jgi:hypothetical protein
VTQQPSRKQFFAKLLGAAAASGVASKALANPSTPAVSASAAGRGRKIEVRGDARSVARRDMI